MIFCGEMAFLEQGRATAAVVCAAANKRWKSLDEVGARELRAIFEAFPGLASRL